MNCICPHCQALLESDRLAAGMSIGCPVCGQTFVIPAVPSAGTEPADKQSEQPAQQSIPESGQKPAMTPEASGGDIGSEAQKRCAGRHDRPIAPGMGKWKYGMALALALLAGFIFFKCSGRTLHIQSPEENGTDFHTATVDGIQWKFSVDGKNAEIKGVVGEVTNACVKIPESFGKYRVTSIADLHASDVEKVEIPHGVVEIKESAFTSCGFKTISLPGSITNIGTGAFALCDNLETIRIPDHVKRIPDMAFMNCDNLAEVQIGKGVTHIGWWAFDECRNLTKVKMGPNVVRIGEEAFLDCRNLTSLTLPDSVKSVGLNAFSGTGMKSLNVPKSWKGQKILNRADVPTTCKIVYGN